MDAHGPDQVLIYLALGTINGAISSFLARSLSSHAATTIWSLEQFLPVRVDISEQQGLVRISGEPGRLHNHYLLAGTIEGSAWRWPPATDWTCGFNDLIAWGRALSGIFDKTGYIENRKTVYFTKKNDRLSVRG